MTIYLQPPITPSRALDRVAGAFNRHAGLTVTAEPESAELVVIPVVGRLDHVTRQAAAITARGQRYAVIQYVLRSSKNRSTADWLPLWKGAQVVWSYYDLPALCREDDQKPKFSFYYAPLGVEDVFQRYYTGPRPYLCGTMARHYLTESCREISLAGAAAETNGGVAIWHVGTPVRAHQALSELGTPSDYDLSELYGQTRYMSGLRRIEGFELPAAEGIGCGCRPVLFDRPHYRQWYEDVGGLFIPEGDRASVIKALTKLFQKDPAETTKKQRNMARVRFGWDGILAGFAQAAGL